MYRTRVRQFSVAFCQRFSYKLCISTSDRMAIISYRFQSCGDQNKTDWQCTDWQCLQLMGQAKEFSILLQTNQVILH